VESTSRPVRSCAPAGRDCSRQESNRVREFFCPSVCGNGFQLSPVVNSHGAKHLRREHDHPFRPGVGNVPFAERSPMAGALFPQKCADGRTTSHMYGYCHPAA
jgi:hypothetical protein